MLNYIPGVCEIIGLSMYTDKGPGTDRSDVIHHSNYSPCTYLHFCSVQLLVDWLIVIPMFFKFAHDRDHCVACWVVIGSQEPMVDLIVGWSDSMTWLMAGYRVWTAWIVAYNFNH